MAAETKRKATTTRKATTARPSAAPRKAPGFRLWYGSTVLHGIEGEKGRKGLTFGDHRAKKAIALIVLGRSNNRLLRKALEDGASVVCASAADRKVMIVTKEAGPGGQMRVERHERLTAADGTSRKVTNTIVLGPKQRARLCAFLAA